MSKYISRWKGLPAHLATWSPYPWSPYLDLSESDFGMRRQRIPVKFRKRPASPELAVFGTQDDILSHYLAMALGVRLWGLKSKQVYLFDPNTQCKTRISRKRALQGLKRLMLDSVVDASVQGFQLAIGTSAMHVRALGGILGLHMLGECVRAQRTRRTHSPVNETYVVSNFKGLRLQSKPAPAAVIHRYARYIREQEYVAHVDYFHSDYTGVTPPNSVYLGDSNANTRKALIAKYIQGMPWPFSPKQGHVKELGTSGKGWLLQVNHERAYGDRRDDPMLGRLFVSNSESNMPANTKEFINILKSGASRVEIKETYSTPAPIPSIGESMFNVVKKLPAAAPGGYGDVFDATHLLLKHGYILKSGKPTTLGELVYRWVEGLMPPATTSKWVTQVIKSDNNPSQIFRKLARSALHGFRGNDVIARAYPKGVPKFTRSGQFYQIRMGATDPAPIWHLLDYDGKDHFEPIGFDGEGHPGHVSVTHIGGTCRACGVAGQLQVTLIGGKERSVCSFCGDHTNFRS